MAVKYIKDHKTQETVYPITKSDCIIDAFSINDLEIDKLCEDSLSVSKHLKGMSYLNLQGLIHYHSKIKDYLNNIPEVLIYTAGENITIENNVISAVVPEVDLSGYATEAYVDLEIANIDIPSLDGYATELWVDDNYEKKRHEYVDLGLPSGLLWATCNVGATKPEESGDYFAWGETQPKSTYNWSTYKWCNGSNNTQTKYNTNSSYGTVDNKTQLELSDDAARANWGGSWRMPTDAELTELRENCTWTWTTQNGVNGYKVTSKKNGNSIFLPAAGHRDASSLYNAGSYGYYWSSSLYTDNPLYAWNVYFGSDSVRRYKFKRYYGFSVRPVCTPQNIPILNNTKTKEEVVDSTDGVYYFTTDTKLIYRNGESYGGIISTENVGLGVPLNLGTKVLKELGTQFYPATHVDAVVGITKHSFDNSSSTANSKTDDVIYFTTDSKLIIRNGISYGGSITAEDVNVVPEEGIVLQAVTFVQDCMSDSNSSFTIKPNYKYIFGERSALTISLEPVTDSTIVNHYMFEFTSGSTATTLSLPASIKWTTEPSIKPNKIYLISIENNLGVIQEWT